MYHIVVIWEKTLYNAIDVETWSTLQSYQYSNTSTVKLLFLSVNNLEIVMSNDSGEVFGVMPSKELWRININDSTKVINIISSGFLFIKNCG